MGFATFFSIVNLALFVFGLVLVGICRIVSYLSLEGYGMVCQISFWYSNWYGIFSKLWGVDLDIPCA